MYTVNLTLADDDTASDTAMQDVTVNNVAPQAGPVVGPTQAVPGQAVSFTGSFTDVGAADTHATEWEVRNSANMVVATGVGLAFNFTVPALGTFDVTFTVTDDDGGVDTAMAQLDATNFFLISPDEQNPGEMILRVSGTPGDDRLTLRKGRGPGSVKFTLRTKGVRGVIREDLGTGIDRIALFGLEGKDRLRVQNNLGEIEARIFGGPGDDRLFGGRGPDLLLGGLGDDRLNGKRGRDILIGGDGMDRLFGRKDDDILVGGSYAESNNVAALSALLAEWTRTDQTYNNRIANLLNGTGLNGGFVLNDTTVTDDALEHRLNGNRDLDWLLANPVTDKISIKTAEVLTTI